MKLNHIYVIVLLMWGLLSSCISEDYSDCYNRYVVNLSYLGDGQTEIFPDKIDKVQMSIFDKAGNCLSRTMLSDEEVAAQSVMLPSLAEGDYRIVFLGNPYSTSTKDLTLRSSFSDLCFGADAYWNGEEVSGNDPLYWASVDQTIEPFDEQRQVTYSTAHFAASHYDVSVEVTGTPSALKIVLEGVSPYTDYNNIAAADAETSYILNSVYDGSDKVTAVCNIMRHQDHENVNLKVLSLEGTELAVVNFAEFLSENSKYIDCSKQEVVIPFQVGFKSAEVEITMPDWAITDVTPEFK